MSTAASPVSTAAQTCCPECDGAIRLPRAPMRGQVVSCPGCAVELEVLTTEPVTVALAPKVEEDWGE